MGFIGAAAALGAALRTAFFGAALTALLDLPAAVLVFVAVFAGFFAVAMFVWYFGFPSKFEVRRF
jgi:hypothetical protein